MYKSYIYKTSQFSMELSAEEKSALNGEHGKTLQTAYRILVATGEATNAEKLVPIKWAHLSGVNYNTIGDSGEEFLKTLSQDAKVKVKTTLNPMGFDFDHISDFKHIDDDFIEKQKSIKAAVIIDGPEAVLNSKDKNNPIKIDNSPPIVDKKTIWMGLFDMFLARAAGIISIPVIKSSPTILIEIAIIAAIKIVNIALYLSGFIPSALAKS